jgi:4-amino-4-deoxy-L-arabinose transferase-like glycosyltransferase
MDDGPIRIRQILFDVAIIFAIVGAFYIARLTDLSIRGEESRWASIAQEMQRSGDWVVPRQQGLPFASRPPMGSWLIALAAIVRGECDLAAVRLPAVLAVFGLSLLVYGYCRSFLPRLGAIVAAMAYPAMPEILQMGRLAESDSVFAFFLGGAYLTWHWGWSRNWSRTATWSISYALLAMATLTKGPQAPVTFCAAIGIYLCATRQWGAIFSRAHAVGLAAFAILIGAWLVPFYATSGAALAWQTLASDSAGRFVGWHWAGFLEHFVRYPLEAIGCTAPWSFLLIAFASQRFRQAIRTPGSHGLYLFLCMAVGFVPCWISPGGQTRYLMPLYPCVAALSGWVVARSAEAESVAWVRSALSGMRWVTLAVVCGFTATIAWLTWGAHGGDAICWKQPIWLMSALIVVTAIAVVLLRGFGLFPRGRVQWMRPLALAAFVGLAYAGVTVNQLKARQTDAEAVFAEVKLQIAGRLVSLGWVHHKFLYLYGGPIEQLPDENADRIPPGSYFCYTSWCDTHRTFPFPYEEIAAVNMDRVRFDRPQTQVIVVHRLSESGHARLSASR